MQYTGQQNSWHTATGLYRGYHEKGVVLSHTKGNDRLGAVRSVNCAVCMRVTIEQKGDMDVNIFGHYIAF